MFIDTHCHLDGYYTSKTINHYLDNAIAVGVTQMIAIGTHEEDWNINLSLHTQYQNNIFYTVGLHPCYVTKERIGKLKALEGFFKSKTPPVALGECGLDYYHLPEDPLAAKAQKELQAQAFKEQLNFARALDCPIIIHSRYALEDTISVLQEFKIHPSRVVFHCFSEGEASMQKLINAGYRASFTGIITYKNAVEVRNSLLLQGLPPLMLETDAPWLAPHPKRGQPNESSFLPYIGAHAAELFGIQIEELARITTQNAHSFFKL